MFERMMSGIRYATDEAVGSEPVADESAPDPSGIPDAAPNGTPAQESEEVDYAQRYNDLRPEFDRRSQELSEMKQIQEALSGQAGPEAQAAALQRYGIELEADEEPDEGEYYDESDPEVRIERLEQTLTEQQEVAEAQQMAEAENDFLVEGIEALEGQEGREFSEDEIAVLASVARANRTDTGAPDLAAAHEHLTAMKNSLQKEWVESKKANRQPGSGIAAQEAVDMSNPDERVKFMADRMEALSDD